MHERNSNNWHILEQPQDPEGKRSNVLGTYAGKIVPISVGIILVSAALIPLVATASFLGSIFSNAQAQITTPRFSVPNSSQAYLQAATHTDPNPAKGGTEVTIVNGSALVAEGSVETGVNIEHSRTGKISLYVVRDGDSLSQIAQMFGVSINTIIWSNDLKNATAISPGQTLVILPVSGVRYTVEKGDTISSIAKEFKGDAKEIAVFNGLEAGSSLAVGTEVIIPGGEIKKAQPVAQTTSRVVRNVGGPVYAGYYAHPLPGAIRTQGIHGYNAVDLAAPIGTPITAAASGAVIISRSGGWNSGYGNYVVISHANGTQTLYAHTSSNIVGVGQNVVQGQVIGYVGSTGLSTGPHLHFEVRGATNPF